MNTFLIYLILSAYVFQSSCAWNLVWADEFNGATLNTKDWNYEVGDQVYNNELEAYTTNNVYVGSGSLRIEARKQSYLSKSYTSGRINTKDKHYFTYGRFEARMKLPKGQGFWPAFWLWPNDDSLPYREIDIMEAIGSQTKMIETTCYVGGSSWENPDSLSADYTMAVDFNLDYHIYAAEWSQGLIKYFVDDVNVFNCKKENAPQWKLDAPNQMFIIFNLAVGGDMPGSPSSSTPFPSSMYVDYVRVYQQDSSGTNNTNQNNTNPGVQVSSCTDLYTSSSLKNGVHYLKSVGKVGTYDLEVDYVGSQDVCCSNCEVHDHCVAWRFSNGQCVLKAEAD